ncbi:MAG: NERD domain-containing protein [Oscillospiraceae bacterium]|nr:NERD domain-containing protein [Oscillospiraceae bacterium]
MSAFFVILAVIAAVVVLSLILLRSYRNNDEDYFGSPDRPEGWSYTPEEKISGIRGEEQAFRIISSVLREGDRLFSNVSISYDGKPTELDFVVVNAFGVFILEVKNYKGILFGAEDDYEWEKYKKTDTGNSYVRPVKNPIKQVRRQIYLLAHYLDYYGVRVWVKGYAILLQGNSPIESPFLLKSTEEIDHAIHTADRTRLNAATGAQIADLLS